MEFIYFIISDIIKILKIIEYKLKLWNINGNMNKN